jgi:hypothetical protein
MHITLNLLIWANVFWIYTVAVKVWIFYCSWLLVIFSKHYETSLIKQLQDLVYMRILYSVRVFHVRVFHVRVFHVRVFRIRVVRVRVVRVRVVRVRVVRVRVVRVRIVRVRVSVSALSVSVCPCPRCPCPCPRFTANHFELYIFKNSPWPQFI